MVELAHPAQSQSWSRRTTEEETRRLIEEWDGETPEVPEGIDPVLARMMRLAEADGIDWVYMGEIGAGTGVAFYPPFMLMWMLTEQELYRRWLELEKMRGFAMTERAVKSGCAVIAMGGDVSCDKGPFISPALYHEFILPVIREHVDLIHSLGARAVYTSDGNHWPIMEDLFIGSGVDGYKEVDKAAGMTWPRLIEEHVAENVCVIGNIDARYTLCLGSPADVRAEVFECLSYGRRSPGGHIIHASHSVHEDVKAENYLAMVDAYREYFGLDKLPR